VRTDIVDVYVFRVLREGAGDARADAPGSGASAASRVEFLQLLRREAPMAGTWHPVMGHVEVDAAGAGETAVACAVREAREEVGLDVRGPACLGLWALEELHPYFVAALDCVLCSPRFAAQVRPEWSPRLDGAEHSAWRWVSAAEAAGEAHAELAFLWPGQRAAAREVLEAIVNPRSRVRDLLRV
jgi:8-oxo-dGTP pyrophosphatase MutT (NUDIX family)